MAFHPFRYFRKHQKVFFAVMLIICMITFVFSGFGSSGADPFYRIMHWIGLSRHQGDEVLPLYGKMVYTDDLDKLRWERQLASEFLLYGSTVHLSKSLDDILRKAQNERKGNENLPGALQLVAKEVNDVFNKLRMMQLYPREQVHGQVLGSLRNVQNLFDHPDVQNNSDLRRDIDTVATWLAVQAWALNPQKPQQEYYFGGTPKVQDLLDFLVWKRQADKLGIVLTSADVSREVNRAWGNDDFLKPDAKFDNNEEVSNFLRSSSKIHKSLTSQDLLDALTDEYRVALAREAVLGSNSGVRGYRNAVDGIHHSPAVATPDEFYKHFQEQRTTLAVSMLPIPVKGFVEKVQAVPNEEDLRNLYARYKDNEPEPSRRQPGFKEPRRVKVQYFSYRSDGPFARKQAAKALELLPLFRLGVPAVPFPAGGGPAWAINLGTLTVADLDHAIRAQYATYREDETRRVVKYDKDDNNIIQGASRFGQGFDLNDQQAAAAQAPAATVGQLLGLAGTGGTPLAAPVTWLSTNEPYERATLTYYASAVLAGSSPSPVTALTLPTRYLHSARPSEEIRRQMVERLETNMAGKLMESRVQAVRKELDKLIASRSGEKLAEYLKKTIPDNGLENFHSMAQTQTQVEMRDAPDPALKALRTAYEQSTEDPFNPFAFLAPRPRPDFVSAMFHSFENPFSRQQERSKQFKSAFEDSTWVFWRAEDQPARVRPFDDIRAQVKEAWYLEQARRLAREEARRIHDELTKQQLNAADAVKFLREQKQGDVFELTNVAHLQAKVNLLPGHKFTSSDFRAYEVPKDRIAYPPADFVDQLLKLKKPGDSLVLADQPVRHFYIAVLMEKPQVPERREFYEVYNARGMDNRIWTEMIDARERKYAEKVIEQLRAEATKNLDGGEYNLSDKVRSRGESSSSDSGE